MIDLHCHLLPGLDDGASSIDDSISLARALLEQGVTTVAATPHVSSTYPVTSAEMQGGVTIVREALASDGLAIDVLPGGEVAFDALSSLDRAALRAFGLAGNPDYLLVEFPYAGWPPDLATTLTDLLDVGITPVLAHPERNDEIQAAPHRLAPLVAEGVLVQLTASSLAGSKGRGSNRAARALIDGHLAHLIASDAHRPSARVSSVSAVRSSFDDDLSAWLMIDVPSAIVHGADRLPGRPAIRRRRSFLRR